MIKSKWHIENRTPDQEQVLNFLAAWKSAWEKKDIAEYQDVCSGF